MNKTSTMFLLLFATAVLVGCRQSTSQENEATPVVNATQTYIASATATMPLASIQQETAVPPATATMPLAPIQQETAVPPPTITPLALTTTTTPLIRGEGALIQLKMES